MQKNKDTLSTKNSAIIENKGSIQISFWHTLFLK